MAVRVRAGFIEPMLLLRTETLPDDPRQWAYEVKLDGYRALAFKTGRTVFLRSRNDNDFAVRYPAVLPGLAGFPNETVVDGELVAFGEDGRPSFGALQNAASSTTPIVYYVFDVLVLAGRDVMRQPFEMRRALLTERVLPTLSEPVRCVGPLDASLTDLVQAVKRERFEGLIAKRRDSPYEPGLRSGAWRKMRVNQGQEFVIGGYTVGTKTFDAVIFGYYEGDRLLYVARTRNGFTPAMRAQLFAAFRPLATRTCPFANLPEATSGRWGQGLTKAKMAVCRWPQPVLVGQMEFVEWTADGHLRHSRFIGLRTDKAARDVVRETPM